MKLWHWLVVAVFIFAILISLFFEKFVFCLDINGEKAYLCTIIYRGVEQPGSSSGS